jgi:hypothetical protein
MYMWQKLKVVQSLQAELEISAFHVYKEPISYNSVLLVLISSMEQSSS